jgi:hypothetical protein
MQTTALPSCAVFRCPLPRQIPAQFLSMRLATLQRQRDLLWGRLSQLQRLTTESSTFSSTGVTINKLLLGQLEPEEDPRLLYGAMVNTGSTEEAHASVRRLWSLERSCLALWMLIFRTALLPIPCMDAHLWTSFSVAIDECSLYVLRYPDVVMPQPVPPSPMHTPMLGPSLSTSSNASGNSGDGSSSSSNNKEKGQDPAVISWLQVLIMKFGDSITQMADHSKRLSLLYFNARRHDSKALLRKYDQLAAVRGCV